MTKWFNYSIILASIILKPHCRYSETTSGINTVFSPSSHKSNDKFVIYADYLDRFTQHWQVLQLYEIKVGGSTYTKTFTFFYFLK